MSSCRQARIACSKLRVTPRAGLFSNTVNATLEATPQSAMAWRTTPTLSSLEPSSDSTISRGGGSCVQTLCTCAGR